MIFTDICIYGNCKDKRPHYLEALRMDCLRTHEEEYVYK